jgi:hypothetical protein
MFPSDVFNPFGTPQLPSRPFYVVLPQSSTSTAPSKTSPSTASSNSASSASVVTQSLMSGGLTTITYSATGMAQTPALGTSSPTSNGANPTSTSTDSKAVAQTVKIGIAVGVSLGFTALVVIGVLLYLLLLRRNREQATFAQKGQSSESQSLPSYESLVHQPSTQESMGNIRTGTNLETEIVEMNSERPVGELQDVKSVGISRQELP